MDIFLKRFSEKKQNIEEKAIQKSPFTINNQTYFASQCYYDDTIINGVSLEVIEGKGLSNNPDHIDYLNHSQKLVYHAGCNILAYSTYRRNIQVVCQTGDLCILKSLSLSTPEKQYVIWGQKIIRSNLQDQKINTQLCIYSVHKKQRIHAQKFLTMHEIEQMFTFLHPIKVIGALHYDQDNEQSIVIFKKIIENNHSELDDQFEAIFDYDLRKLKYQVESNTYFFANKNQILCLKLKDTQFCYDENIAQHYNPQNFALTVEPILKLDTQIIHFCVNQTYLAILVGDQNCRILRFYSIFNHSFLFAHEIQSRKRQTQLVSKATLQRDQPFIDFFEFRKNIILGIYGDSSCIAIYSIYEDNIRHVRDTQLELENCLKIQNIFVNPFSSEVMVVSRHYQLESTVPTSIRSKKIIQSSQVRFKNLFLEVSSFFITMQASMINVKKLGLSKRKYSKILTLSWTSQTYYQTQNSIICNRWEEKFDAIIKCSAIHPTGQFIALGFSDCFKIYYLTYQGLQHSFICQNVKQCASLAFSEHGSQFSVATSCVIFVYQCYSFIRKHQISLGMTHKIDEIAYTKNYLYCTTKTNKLWVFNSSLNYNEQFTFNPRNHIESTNSFDDLIFQMMKKNIPEKHKTTTPNVNRVNSIFYDSEVGMVIFSAVQKIYFINSHNYECMGAFDFEDVSCMEYCKDLSTLFLGTFSGKIIAYPWPNKPINISSKLPTFNCHNEKIQKIKITTDLFFVISITQNCLYKHQLTLLSEMHKISKYELQREYAPSIILSLDFIQRKGLCLFSVDQYNKKYEQIKQNEEQAINLDFMLPQERQKQKNCMLDKLEVGRQECKEQLNELYQPLKVKIINVKDKNRNIEEQIKKLRNNYIEAKSNQINEYRKKITELCSQKQVLQKKLSDLRINFTNNIKKDQSIMKNQLKREQLGFYIHLSELENKNNAAQREKDQTVKNFLELKQIDEEKKVFYQEVIKQIDEEIGATTQRSGYLMCRNTNLEKQINSKKRKIQQVQDMIYSIKMSIKSLPQKRLNKQKQLHDEQDKKIFFETEKRYLKQTKKLIEKNKGVNVSIQVYEKQKNFLIELQKQIVKFEQQIDIIIDYLNKEKKQKKGVEQKLEDVIDRVKQIMQIYKVKTSQRIKIKNQYKTFKYNVALYLDGIYDLSKLKEMSQIEPKDMIKAPVRIQKQIGRRQKKIDKMITAQEKSVSLMKNDRKVFSNQKKKMYMQNQDLLVTYNFLSHRNKYLANVINSQEDPRKMSIKIKANKKKKQILQNLKPTPFQKYINFRTTRRIKTTPCAQYQL